jgi:hypothetical protein
LLKRRKEIIEVKKKLISGILATMFLVTMITVAFPARVSASFPGGTVKIGIVGPRGLIQWDSMWEGASIARDLINKEAEFSSWPGQKGMLVYNGTPGGALAKVELVDIDEHSNIIPDPSAAISELLTKLNANPDMQFLIGGFRSECVVPMRELAMDYAAVHGRPIWFICGAATPEIIPTGQYDMYKYMFRVTPPDSTTMANTLGAFIKQIVAPKLAQLYFSNASKPVPTLIIAENLAWCDSMVAFIQGNGAAFGMNLRGVRRPSPITTDFSSDIAAATAAGAKLVIHAFSSVAGANFIMQYGALKPPFACVGINVESQAQQFYASVGGACEYECFLSSSGTRTDVNPAASPLSTAGFWGVYVKRCVWEDPPIYTAFGAYDAIIGLSETSYDNDPAHASYQKGWSVWLKQGNIDKLITHIETLGVSDGFAWERVLIGGSYFRSGILGYFKFTGVNGKGHDVYCSAATLSPLSDGVVRPLVVQWQAGRMEVVWPRDQSYSRKWIVPPWMYSLETDIAGGDMVPTGVPGYSYNTPDTKVSAPDADAIAGVWLQVPPFNRLECDMQPYDHFIDLYDLSRVGMDWGKTELPK